MVLKHSEYDLFSKSAWLLFFLIQELLYLLGFPQHQASEGLFLVQDKNVYHGKITIYHCNATFHLKKTLETP